MQKINIGTLPNDTTGDPLRAAFTKINENFVGQHTTVTATTFSNVPGCILLSIPSNTVSHGSFQITTRNPATADFQSQMMSVVMFNNSGDVAHSNYAVMNNGANVANVYAELAPGNLQILCDPIANVQLTHTITYRVNKV